MAEVAPEMLLQVLPLFVDPCHCTVGVGFPLAAAEKEAVCPALTVWLVGWVVTAGTKNTVNRAALVAAEPAVLVKIARNCLLLSAAWAVKL